MNAIIFSAVWGVLMMFSAVFLNRLPARHLATVGAILLFAANLLELSSGHPLFEIKVMELLRVSNYGLTFIAVASGAMLLYFLLSGKDVEAVGEHKAEYFALIFFSFTGVALCASFNNLIMLFLGIEIMSIPMYILTGADKQNLKSNEASLKYFLMGAFSTGILLLGMAFIYGGNTAGTLFLHQIQISEARMPVMMASGLVLMLAAMSFKVSAAPFHFWTPDVYDGAPTVFTSFMSTIVKAAGFFAFVRLFESIFGLSLDQWQPLVVFILFATLLIGNVTAVFQQSVKRMLAYSSIAQAGFMMFSVFSMNAHGREAVVLYGAAYSLATIGMFAVLLRLSDYTIDGFNGLAQRKPVLAFVAVVFLLSLTGVPLTAGFQGKFWVLMSAVENGNHFWLVIAALCFAAVSAFYYFRVIQAMYFKPAPEGAEEIDLPADTRFFLLFTAVLIIAIGVFPEMVIGWIYH
jgi:NADH-quinone oxidoreductase subunit N